MSSATKPITTAESDKNPKRSKRKGPFKVQVGSVVALRQCCTSVTTIHTASKTSHNNTGAEEFSNSSPLRHAGTEGVSSRTSWVYNPHNVKAFWMMPVAAKDDGLALVGRLIQFPKSAIEGESSSQADHNSRARLLPSSDVTGSSEKAKRKKNISSSSLVCGEVVAVQYPPTAGQNRKKQFTVGVLTVDESSELLPNYHQSKLKHRIAENSRKSHQLLTVTLHSASSASGANWKLMKTIRVASMEQEKANKASTFPFLVGDKFDSIVQKKKNFIWLARRSLNNDPSSSSSAQQERAYFRPAFDPPLFHGEVVSLCPDSGIVTLRRLWIPEYTAAGRLNHQGNLEAFDDDNTSGTNCNDGSLHCVCIDSLLVIGISAIRCSSFHGSNERRVKNCSTAGSIRRPLLITHLYSPSIDAYMPISLTDERSSNGSNTQNLAHETLSRRTSKLCHGCRRITSDQRGAIFRSCESTICCRNRWCTECCNRLLRGEDCGEKCWIGPCCTGVCECLSCSVFAMLFLSRNMKDNLSRAVEATTCEIDNSVITDGTESHNTTTHNENFYCCILHRLLTKASLSCAFCKKVVHKNCSAWERRLTSETQDLLLNDEKSYLWKLQITGDHVQPRDGNTIRSDAFLCRTCAYQVAKKQEDGNLEEPTGPSTNRIFYIASQILKASCPVSFDFDWDFLTTIPNLWAKSSKALSATKYSAKQTVRNTKEDEKVRNTMPAPISKQNGSKKRMKKADPDKEIIAEADLRVISNNDVVYSFDNDADKFIACSRMIPYDPRKRTRYSFANQDCVNATGELLLKPDPDSNTITRNLRLQTGVKLDSSADGRAARANQRRMLKDKVFATELLAFDTLSGREPHLRFGRSNIHSWGVFAEESINKGDLLMEYRGEIIGNAVSNAREIEYELAKIGSDYMFRIDSTTVCDATKQGNMARFINASCNPNCYTKIINFMDKKRIVIYAKKDIMVGEELCYDYKFPLECDEKKRIPCHCGARNCKGFMNWNKKFSVIACSSEHYKKF